MHENVKEKINSQDNRTTVVSLKCLPFYSDTVIIILRKKNINIVIRFVCAAIETKGKRKKIRCEIKLCSCISWRRRESN